jgi:hypothetical protein
VDAEQGSFPGEESVGSVSLGFGHRFVGKDLVENPVKIILLDLLLDRLGNKCAERSRVARLRLGEGGG